MNLISTKTEHDLILKDRQPTITADKSGNKQVVSNIEMEQPVLDINAALNRASNDPRSQARFITMVKHACLNFNSSLIEYKNNKFQQRELIQVNQQMLMDLQNRLGSKGFYDELFKSHAGKSFYLRSVNDYITKGNRMIDFKSQQD